MGLSVSSAFIYWLVRGFIVIAESFIFLQSAAVLAKDKKGFTITMAGITTSQPIRIT